MMIHRGTAGHIDCALSDARRLSGDQRGDRSGTVIMTPGGTASGGVRIMKTLGRRGGAAASPQCSCSCLLRQFRPSRCQCRLRALTDAGRLRVLAQSSTSRLWLTVGHRHCRACIRARETLLYGVARRGTRQAEALLLELRTRKPMALRRRTIRGTRSDTLEPPPSSGGSDDERWADLT